MKLNLFGPFARRPARLTGIVLVSVLLASLFLPLYRASAADTWWDYAWQYRKKITIDYTKVAGALTNFPILISITDTDLASKAQTNGYDIAFTDQSAIKLDHEIEYYNAGTLVAWVEATSLSSTANTILYMYYGNPSASNQQSKTATWGPDYVLVQHLSEASGSGTVLDSSGYGNNGTPNNGVSQGAVGKIDSACSFDGTNDYISVADANSLEGTAALTLEVWVKQSTDHANGIVNKNGNDGYMLQGWNDKNLYFAVSTTAGRAATTTPPPLNYPLNEWYHLVAVSTGTQLLIYVNAAQKASSSKVIAVPTNAAPVQIGWAGALNYYFNGLLDEVRISKTTRSPTWIQTEYNNQNSPGTFSSLDPEEVVPSVLSISHETPVDGAINVGLFPTLKAQFANTRGSMNITFSSNATGSWQVIGNFQNVGTGYYSVDTTNIDMYQKKYWWKVDAEDAVHGKSESKTYSFTTGSEPDFWWDTAWQYRKRITINHSRVTADLTDFPVLVSVTDTDLASKAQSNGYDIAFTNKTGGKLNHEIERFDSVTGTLAAWVKIPSLSSAVDTVLYMYYGNLGASNQQNPTGTWDTNYVMVQHLEEPSGTFSDSTSYSNAGSAVGGLTRNVAGKINGACQFDGSTGYINVADADSLEGMAALTLELWVKQSANHNNGIIYKGSLGGSTITYLLQGWGDAPYTGLYFSVNGMTPRPVAPPPPLGGWYHLVAVSTGTQLRIYVNGTQTAATDKATAVPLDSNPVMIGQNNAGNWFNGQLDEVRISKTARNSAWITTSYNSQNNPSTFYSIGGEEPQPREILIQNETPTNGAINVFLNPTLRANFLNFYGLMNITFSTNATGAWLPIATHTNVATGYHSADPTNMNSYVTKYWWRAYAENSASGRFANKTYSFTTKPFNVGPIISNPLPLNESTGVPRTLTQLSFTLTDFESDPMNYTVTTSPNIGSGSGTNVAAGTYYIDVSGLRYSTTYTWTVSATDGIDATLAKFVFRTQQLPAGAEWIGDYACMGLGYMGTATGKNTVYAVWQGPQDVSGSGVGVWFAEFDKGLGWVVKNQSVFTPPWGERHPFYGYWGGKYHVCWFDGATTRMAMADSTTFEGFQSIDGQAVQYYLPGLIPGNSVPSAYQFSDDYVWVLGSDTSTGDEAIAYWKWTEATGWSAKTIISSTANPGHGTNFPALLPVNDTAWYIYYTAYSSNNGLYYVKSADQGQTWGAEQTSNIASDVSLNSRPTFARYGNNYYIFIIDAAGDVAVYNSTDGVTWGNKQVLYSAATYQVAQGYAVDQTTLVWTASNTVHYKTSSQGHYGVGDQIGGVTYISEMLAHPGASTLNYPSNGAVFAHGTTSVQLKVAVHGSQTYDVAFYWADGTFIGEDKLLTEGDIATVIVSGLSGGTTYQWYAIARGSTYGYWGGQPATTSDENRSTTWAFSVQERQAPYVLNENPQDGAINVFTSLSQLTFTITDPQSQLMNYTVETFPDVGTGSATNVDDGTYTVSIYPLKRSRIYTWQVNVTDGTNWTNMTYTFQTEVPADFDPFEEGWRYRRTITIDHDKVAADLTNFPVLISFTDSGLAAHAQADGDDIMFMNDTGLASKLSHEIESYTAGTIVAWVKIPQLSSTADTIIYMYYGNPRAINQQNVAETWGLDYVLIQHLKESTGSFFDSSSYDNDGTAIGGLTRNVAGKINGACQFGGSGYIQVADANSLEGMPALTLELWVKQSTYHNNGIVNKAGSLTPYTYLLQGWSDGNLYWAANGGDNRAFTSGGTTPLNQWYHLVAVSNGTHLIIYVNSFQSATSAKTTAVPTDSMPVQIGQNGAGSNFSGLLDEVRISRTARSAAWITTEYNSQNDPSSFYTLGSEVEAEARIRITPASAEKSIGDDISVYIEVDYATDLYGWEFELEYDQTILNAASILIVPGGLNEPTYTYRSVVDQINGRLWWCVTTTSPTSSGISYHEHMILKILFNTIGSGASNLGLYGTNLGNHLGGSIPHVDRNGTITVHGIDLTVTSINIVSHGCSLYKNDTNVDGSPYYYPVEVTIHNAGEDAGAFYVKLEVYWIDGSLVEASMEMSVSNLNSRQSKLLSFTTLFHPMQTGLYRLIVTVDSRNDILEGTETNNTLTQDNIPVAVMGDINGDDEVNILDAVKITQAWGAKPSDTHWKIEADLNHDGEINILDATIMSLRWGETR